MQIKANDGSANSPIAAVILYGSSIGSCSFASVHDVMDTPTGPQIAAGVPATTQALNNLFDALNPANSQRAALISSSILSLGPDWMLWYSRSTTRRVFFNTRDHDVQSAVVPLPAMLWLRKGDTLSVWALKNNRRPGASTHLYHSGLYNVYADGKVCMGTTRVPPEYNRADPKAWEALFFQSEFTHSNVHGTSLVKYRGGHKQFWKAMLKGKFSKTGFPTDVLVEQQRTVQTVLNDINRQRSGGYQ